MQADLPNEQVNTLRWIQLTDWWDAMLSRMLLYWYSVMMLRFDPDARWPQGHETQHCVLSRQTCATLLNRFEALH